MSVRFAWFFDKKIKKKVWVADMWARKAVLAIQTAITGITSRLTTIENAGYQTSSDVSAAIATAIGGITELEYLVVSTLPASGTKGVIYLVPHQHDTRDIYDEYIWVNSAFEKIGSTDVDLSGYLKDTDISAWAKASTKPAYTAAEVGALPNTTVIPSKTSDLTNDSGYITSSALPSVPSPSTASPAMDGAASAGTSGAWSRGDHVHPHDSSKADKATTLSGYGITNAYTKTEVDGMIPTIPTNVSAFTNDAGYITEQALSPTAFSALSPNQSRCTIEAGGFIKIGRIVYVDVTITMATGASTTSFTAVIAEESEIAPLKGAYSILTAVNNTSRTKTTKALVGAGGNILICNASSGELVYITGCYISAS